MSRQSAWEYYTRETRQVREETATGSDLNEDEAMRVATDDVNWAQRRRRSAEP